MKDRLRELLFEYITRQAPELLIKGRTKDQLDRLLSGSIEQVSRIGEQLLTKGLPVARIEIVCSDLLTRSLRPSRYHYIAGILATYQPGPYARWREMGTLTLQVSRLIDLCEPTFSKFAFRPATAADEVLRLAICEIVETYVHGPG